MQLLKLRQSKTMLKKVKRHNDDNDEDDDDDEKKLCSGGDSGVKPALISREVSQEPANQQTSVPTAYSNHLMMANRE